MTSSVSRRLASLAACPAAGGLAAVLARAINCEAGLDRARESSGAFVLLCGASLRPSLGASTALAASLRDLRPLTRCVRPKIGGYEEDGSI